MQNIEKEDKKKESKSKQKKALKIDSGSDDDASAEVERDSQASDYAEHLLTDREAAQKKQNQKKEQMKVNDHPVYVNGVPLFKEKGSRR